MRATLGINQSIPPNWNWSINQPAQVHFFSPLPLERILCPEILLSGRLRLRAANGQTWMKTTLTPPSAAITVNGIIWLEAPPPEIEVTEGFEIVARWVMEVGQWVNEEAFTPRINFVTRPSGFGSKKFHRNRVRPRNYRISSARIKGRTQNKTKNENVPIH